MRAVNAIERQIARFMIRELLRAGYKLGVNDGEETVLKHCASAKQVFNAMFSTDEDRLLVYRNGKPDGWVYLVYGNDGFDVINDYTTNLESVMDGPVQKYIDRLETRGY